MADDFSPLNYTASPRLAGDNTPPGAAGDWSPLNYTANPESRDKAPVDQSPPAETAKKSILDTSFRTLPSATTGEGSFWDDATHGLAVGTRDVVQGAIGGLADLATLPGRMIQRGINAVAGPGTVQVGTPPSQLIDQAASNLPRWAYDVPRTPQEQVQSTAAQGAAAMLPWMGAGVIPAVARAVPALAPAATGVGAVTTPIAGATGAVTGQAAADSPWVPDWAKPTVNVLGNIVGGGIGNAATRVAERLANSARGSFNTVRDAYNTLNMTPPSIAPVSGGPTARTAEAVVSNVLGGQEVMIPRNQTAVQNFGRANDETAAMLHFNATGQGGVVPTAAVSGRTAQDAIRDWRFNDQNPDSFPATQGRMFQPVDTRMAGQPVDPSGLRASLQAAATDQGLAGMPETQAALVRPQAQRLLEALDNDAPPGTMLTWEQAQAYRRRIGDMTGTPAFQQDLGQQALSGIYGGVAGDLQRAADGAGVGNQFRAANAYSTRGYNFINRVASHAVETNNPNQDVAPDVAARRLLALPGGDLQQLREFVPAAADTLGAHKIANMDTPNPGQAYGDNPTSVTTFGTNLNRSRTDPLAHAALFGADPAVAARVNAAGTVADSMRQTAQYVNPSRTAYTNLALSLVPSVLTGAESHGLLGALGGAVAAPGIFYGGAKVLTNPALIRLMGAQAAGPRVPARYTGLLGAMPDVENTNRQ